MDILDCRGLACPAPVLKTKELLESTSSGSVKILVDNQAARQNVSRFLRSQGFEPQVEAIEGGFAVVGYRSGDRQPSGAAAVAKAAVQGSRTMIMVATDKMGSGDDTLGEKLMFNFLSTLKEMEGLWRMVFVNNGVKLTIEGAATLPAIQQLEESGVDVLVCGTCLIFFNLLEKKQVGETTNMLDIVTSMEVADKVINI
jgi:selenium metabolism protein YedF